MASGGVVIRSVRSAADLKTFVLLPWTTGIYDNDHAWVPPIIRDQIKMLDRKHGSFYEIGDAELFLAYRDNRPVGRISAHVNHLYEQRYGNRTGFFGFFESINDQAVADALFDAAASWLKRQGKEVIQGPQSFSIYESVGFETSGGDILPTSGLFHFAPYYPALAEAKGFQKCVDWHCFLVRDIEDYRPYLSQVKESFMKDQNITYRTLKRREISQRAREVMEIFNVAWAENWGHLPLTEKQFKTFFKELRLIVIPELAIFAEDKGKTIGFCITVADASPALRILNGRLYPWRFLRAWRAMKRSRRVRTIVMGVLPEYRGLHIDDVFYLKTIEKGTSMGYNASDCSMVVETNRKMINALNVLRADCYKTYRIYERDLW